jgi:stage II sporulation protein D
VKRRVRRVGAAAARLTRVRLWARRRRSYSDGHIVRVSTGNRRAQVLRLHLDEYLAGAVTAETSADWNDEALKAQAVASRSLALHRLAHPRTRRYDVVTTALDQYFVLPRLAPDRVWASVEATRGEYLTLEAPGRASPVPLQTFFHDSCGGGTDTPSSVWKAAASSGYRAATCTECQRSPRTWATNIEHDELRQAAGLRRARRCPLNIEAVEQTPSGRLRSLRVSSDEETTVVTAEALRAMLGYGRIRSARFAWTVSPDGIHLEGVGCGHGVGLCQRGARGMAARGSSYVEILAYYYTGSWLVRPTAAHR